MKSASDIFWYSFKSLWHNRVRSALTVLGIVIGIASIVALISISQGLSASINDILMSFGSNNVMVMPGSLSNQMSGGGAPNANPMSGRLFEKDMDAIKTVPGVQDVSGYIMNSQQISFRDRTLTMTIFGVDDSYFKLFGEATLPLAEGRYLRSSDRDVVVIGADIADGKTHFDRTLSVGQFVYIGKDQKKFRVVGILKKFGGVRSDDDNSIIISYDDMRDLSAGFIAKKEVNGIMFRVADGFNVSEVASQVELKLANSHKVKLDDKDFSIITSESLMKQTSQITDLLSLFLGFIASISLAVGGVGVMNTMYMAVMERTREIGTLKAIGASNNAILSLFIFESGLLGLLGGLIGLFLGSLISLIVVLAGFKTAVTLPLALFALTFSFVLGLVSGILPALQASKLPPIEALRYE